MNVFFWVAIDFVFILMAYTGQQLVYKNEAKKEATGMPETPAMPERPGAHKPLSVKELVEQEFYEDEDE